MITLQNDRLTVWCERIVLLLSIFYLCVHTLPRAWNKLNTDFPNYYLAASLAREHYDTSRMYEWVWLQREKDRRGLDVPAIGLLPITPFSTLAVWPLTLFPPLTAKRVWISINLALLLPLCWLLRSMTGLSYRRVALAFALSFPLHRNLLYGQLYLLLLLLIVAACWAYLQDHHAVSGFLVGIAAALKIFPVLLLVFFLQRKAWRALIAAAVTGLAAAAISIDVFGWNVHRTYLREVLPWTLHGEGLLPYVTASASITSVLHYLFLSEPQWNPHPWHNSPLWYALLQPTVQMLALAPAILLIRRTDERSSRVLLEWSALIVAALAISTIPASYNFVLLVLPLCVVSASLLRQKRYAWLAGLLAAYLGIGFPIASPTTQIGPAILLYVPRLPLMLLLLGGIYLLLLDEQRGAQSWDWTGYGWLAAMAAFAASSIAFTLHRERAVREEYVWRLPLQIDAFLVANPKLAGEALNYIAFTPTGYHLSTVTAHEEHSDSFAGDALSFFQGSRQFWVERAVDRSLYSINLSDPSSELLRDARDPMLSRDGTTLAFIRDQNGRGSLMVQRSALPSHKEAVSLLTPRSLNVYEAAFLTETDYAFSAVDGKGPPQIYLTDAQHRNAPLGLTDSRYPALSSDGKWMAYSHFDHGMWNLWVRNQNTGGTRRVADLPCNQIQPSWESDSKTLLYATDCGRSLWFTAISRRRVIPSVAVGPPQQNLAQNE